MEDTGQLTVIIIPIVGGAALARCVEAVKGQGARVIVLGSQGRHHPTPVTEAYFVDHDDLSVPRRRMKGAAMAQTPLIAFLEDTCVPGEAWCDAVRSALSEDDVAGVAGPILVDPDLPPSARSLGLCEYGRFAPPRLRRLATGQRSHSGRIGVHALPGSNFAFKRALLAGLATSPDGMVDNDLFDASTRSGALLVFDDGMRATYREVHLQGVRLTNRFHHGRIYGGRSLSGRSGLHRLLQGALAILVPPLLVSRTLRDAPAWLWRSPATILSVIGMHIAWGMGEMLGKITGSTGRSIENWI
jgi:hypothetical protein